MNECNIAKDLMPLYADDMASPDSVAYVEKHMASCPTCRESWRKLREELPMKEQTLGKETATKVKKAVWKERLRITAMVLAAILVTVVLGTAYHYYYWWEDGAYSIVKTFAAPNGERSIALADLSTAGFFETEGNQLRFYYEDGINRYHTDWRDVEVHWAPDSQTSFFVIENAEGETELRIVDQKEDHGGGTWNIPGLIPAEEKPDLSLALTDLCRTTPEFPTGWAQVEFAFFAWNQDCETVTLTFETDNGHTGILDYHYPTETIVSITVS